MLDKAFIHSLITELLGCNAIWANQNGPKPSKSFATIRLYAFRGTGGLDEALPTAQPGVLNVTGEREATLEVQYFGTGAALKLEALKQSLERPTIVDRCMATDVVFFDCESVQDITELLDGSRFEERASVDLHIRFRMQTQDNPGYVIQVNITGNDHTFAVKEENNG